MTDVGSAGELIRHEESGIVISVGDERELVVAMTRLMDEPETRARLGAAAREAAFSLPLPEELLKQQRVSWERACGGSRKRLY